MPATFPLPELCSFGLVELSARLRRRDVSAVEVMGAYLDHIDRVNPVVNAIVSLRPRAVLLAEAEAADRALARGDAVGALHGIPQAIKDLALTKGLRTTWGSPIFADHVPDTDAIYVERMRAAGALLMGKTNVPEFGYGSNSYNPVFGLTRNAYDPDRVGGGSSGGAAVALATRMLPVADGSDMGGSLRNPAAFNNLFGLRPSQGRVPAETADSFYGQMTVEGAMGRSVRDLAALLSVQAGYDPRAPLSLGRPAFRYEEALEADPATMRFGWLGDLGGKVALEPGILDLCEDACRRLAGTGASVEPVSIPFDLESMWQAWVTLRAQSLAGKHDAHYDDPRTRALLKPEAIWEIERGRALSALDVYRAGTVRAAWYKALLAVFREVDFLLLPAAQVFPFPADTAWPATVAGRTMDSYHRWMEVVVGPTMAGLPSLSVPAGFNEAGWPTGLQIVGSPRADLDVLRAGAVYESACPWAGRLPPMLGGPAAGATA